MAVSAAGQFTPANWQRIWVKLTRPRIRDRPPAKCASSLTQGIGRRHASVPLASRISTGSKIRKRPPIKVRERSLYGQSQSVNNCGDGLNLDELVAAAKNSDTHQRARHIVAAKCLPNHVPRRYQIEATPCYVRRTNSGGWVLLTDVAALELFVELIVPELGLRVRFSLRNDLEVELALDLAVQDLQLSIFDLGKILREIFRRGEMQFLGHRVSS
jgi:hypothetical protein